jgi:hypothetical protein
MKFFCTVKKVKKSLPSEYALCFLVLKLVVLLADVGVYGLVDLNSFLGRDETIREQKNTLKKSIFTLLTFFP